MYRLNRYDFLYICNIICELFPNQISGTYYTIGCQGQRASGKLYDAYTGYRKKLSKCGLITRNSKARQAQSVHLQIDSPGSFQFK